MTIKDEHTLTRKVLIEKSPRTYNVIIVFISFLGVWYSDFPFRIFKVRQCLSEEDMDETGFYGYENFLKVVDGNYKEYVIRKSHTFKPVN